MTKAEQITELTTKLSRYEAMMAAAHAICINTQGGFVVNRHDGYWIVGSYDETPYPSPLEAFEALQKESR